MKAKLTNSEYWKKLYHLADSLLMDYQLDDVTSRKHIATLGEHATLKNQPEPPPQIDIETLREKLLLMRYTTKKIAYNHALGYHNCINELLIWTKEIKDNVL